MRVSLEEQPQNPIPDLSVAYAPEIISAGNSFAMAPYRYSKLPLRMFEACRIATAVINGCTVCQNWRAQRDLALLGIEDGVIGRGDEPDEAMYRAVLEGDLSALTARERVAVRFSQAMGTDPQGLAADEQLWAELHSHLSDAEIVDLTYSTAAWMALGRVAHVLGVDAACSVGGPLESEAA